MIRKHCHEDSPLLPTLADDAQKALLNYPWPGNARELDNVIQRALVLQNQNCIEAEHLQLPTDEESNHPEQAKLKSCDLEQHEYDLIERVIQQNNGNRREIAAILGVSERTLRYKLSRMREKGYVV